MDRTILWELHSWRPCETCGLNGSELAEPFIIEQTIFGGVNEPVKIRKLLAPPMARFLSPEEAKRVFADQPTEIVEFCKPIEVTSFADTHPRVIPGRRIRLGTGSSGPR